MSTTIEYCDIVEQIEIGNLFEQIGFPSSIENVDSEGDSFISNEWSIEVESLDTFYPIEGFRWTMLEKQVIMKCINNDKEYMIKASNEHIVFSYNEKKWVKIKDLKIGDQIITKDGVSSVSSIEETDESDRLCDMQVSISHSYYTNNILSHNSHFLVSIGANALLKQYNVLHYTFELSEFVTGIRYDSYFTDIPSNDVITRKDDVITLENDLNLGKLIIKQYAPNSASVNTLRAHIEKLFITKGFKPDIIIIDYIDNLCSSRHYESPRHELKLLYEEVRGLGIDLAIPIWSASQSNKEGANSDIVDLTNMAEAYGKGAVVDVMIGISRKSNEKALGVGRLFLAKNRLGRDGVVFPVKIDTAVSKFKIMSDSVPLEEQLIDEQIESKRKVKEKWESIKQLKRKQDIVASEDEIEQMGSK